MTPPPAGWRILGGANYKSARREPVNPQRALREWLALADAITAAGGEISVLPPPAPPALLTGLLYTANAGWLVAEGRFRLARLSVPHRQAEAPHLRAALRPTGWRIEVSQSIWEGQADMCWLSPQAVLLSYGVRSVKESVDEVRAALPAGVTAHAARLREPFFHGDTCMDVIDAEPGPLWLACPAAFATREEYVAARAFAERSAIVIEVSEADALAYACNSLSLGKRLLAPLGLSAALLAALAQRSVEVQALDFGELFGKGGGGPRCLVNELRGLSRAPAGTAYAEKRAALVAAVETYPAVASER